MSALGFVFWLRFDANGNVDPNGTKTLVYSEYQSPTSLSNVYPISDDSKHHYGDMPEHKVEVVDADSVEGDEQILFRFESIFTLELIETASKKPTPCTQILQDGELKKILLNAAKAHLDSKKVAVVSATAP